MVRFLRYTAVIRVQVGIEAHEQVVPLPVLLRLHLTELVLRPPSAKLALKVGAPAHEIQLGLHRLIQLRPIDVDEDALCLPQDLQSGVQRQGLADPQVVD